MNELIIYAVFAYVIWKLITGPVGRKLMELLGLVRASHRSNGSRKTAHDLIDGLFDAGQRTRERVSEGRERFDERRDSRAKDYQLDEQEEELTLFFGQQDLIITPGVRAGFEIFLVDTRGNETRIDRKRMERFLKVQERRRTLSRAQMKAMRAFFERYRQ